MNEMLNTMQFYEKTLPPAKPCRPRSLSSTKVKGLASSVPFLGMFIDGQKNGVYNPRARSYRVNKARFYRVNKVDERSDALHQFSNVDFARETFDLRLRAERFKQDPARAAFPPRNILPRTFVAVVGSKAPQATDGDSSAAQRAEGGDATGGVRSQTAMGAPRKKLRVGEDGATELGSARHSRPTTSMSVNGGRRMPPFAPPSGEWVWVRVAKNAPRGSKSLDASGRPTLPLLYPS
ncbi:hypothetical protein T484DRAFT_1945019 [Baffinella frigidus]|nr:hypothetical protein T484DRAFT_1945019 [Cryptophyta sp. CCMP2293]